MREHLPREQLSLTDLYPLMREVFDAGGVFEFCPHGTSMLPMLRDGEDLVELVKANPNDLQIGDVLFYRRDNGQFVLHRLISTEGDLLHMCGDGQFVMEYGVRRDQVLGKLIGYTTGGVHKSIDSEEYKAYRQERVSRFPFYRRNRRVYQTLRSIKHIFRKPSQKS